MSPNYVNYVNYFNWQSCIDVYLFARKFKFFQKDRNLIYLVSDVKKLK